MNVKTDNYPGETSWQLFNECTGTAEKSRNLDMSNPYSAANTNFSDEYCVPYARYTFTVYDSYGDGVCCSHGNGDYSVELGQDNNVVAQGGQFYSMESTAFGSCPQPTSNPTLQPIYILPI